MKPDKHQGKPSSRKPSAMANNQNEEPPQIEEVTGEKLAEQQEFGIGEKREHQEMDKRPNEFTEFDETIGERKAREEQAEEPDDKAV